MTMSIETSDTYEALAREWPEGETFHDNRGGVDLTYITGEQAVSRLNEVLGYDNWSFTILNSEVIEDEVLVLGELRIWSARTGGDSLLAATRQQYGSQKIKRKRDTGTILDIGFDYKGAATDALKKCASLVGVGLYLSKKEQKAARAPARQAPPPQQWDVDGNVVGRANLLTITCETCGEEMRDTTRNDGSVWLATEKAEYSRKRYNGRVLCYNCSRNAG